MCVQMGPRNDYQGVFTVLVRCQDFRGLNLYEWDHGKVSYTVATALFVFSGWLKLTWLITDHLSKPPRTRALQHDHNQTLPCTLRYVLHSYTCTWHTHALRIHTKHYTRIPCVHILYPTHTHTHTHTQHHTTSALAEWTPCVNITVTIVYYRLCSALWSWLRCSVTPSMVTLLSIVVNLVQIGRALYCALLHCCIILIVVWYLCVVWYGYEVSSSTCSYTPMLC